MKLYTDTKNTGSRESIRQVEAEELTHVRGGLLTWYEKAAGYTFKFLTGGGDTSGGEGTDDATGIRG